MRISKLCLLAAALLLAALPAWGCSKGSAAARDKVDEAVRSIEASRPLLEDLLDLDGRFNELGTRFSDVDDTIAEGKSLAETAMLDVEELERRYAAARDLLREAMAAEGAGKYGDYARFVLQAVEKELEALAVNRDLLNAAWDMLDVLPRAERQEQLSYYVEEIDRLTREVSSLMEEATEAAAAADAYRKGNGL